MDETEIARIAVDEGLLSSVELDRVRRDLSASGGSLLTVLEQAGLLRTADVERIRRERIGRSTTHIPGELVTTTHHRSIPDEARAAGLDPKSEFGRYTLVEKIGSGGMGAIWKSWDNVLGRWCALKLLHEEHGRHEDHRERFLREARAAARLAHPNIVQVYEVGQLGDQIFIALEYVPGETLRQRISHRATGPELRRRIELVRQSCEGIGAAHQAGITHRDVKPENVLVLPTPKGGQAKVADFGLAVDNTVVTRLTVAGDVFGTPAYMAPEQALGLQEIVGPATDVFAVGCILYEIVAGKLPFDADQAAASVYNTIHTDPPPLRKLAPKVHRDLETIIAKCLEKDPPRRYRDGRDLADDLGRYMAGEPILARPAGTIVRLARKARRNPALAFAIGAVLLLSASLTGILWYEQIARGESILRDLEQAQSLEEQAAKSPRLLTSAAARYQSVLREEPGNETALAGLARIAKILQAKESQDLEAQGVVTRRIAERDAQAARAALLDPLRLPGAGEICDLLVANHPGFPPSWELRAEYLWKTGRPSEALSDLVAVGEMGPESRNSRHLRVMCLVDLRRSLEAEKAIGEPDDLSGVELAAVRLSEGRYGEAREALSRVRSRTAVFHLIAGLIDARSSGFKAGLGSFEAALALDPALLPALLAAVQVVRETAGPAAAASRAREAVEMAPAHLGARLLLGEMLSLAGDLPEAARHIRRAAALAGSPAPRVLRFILLLHLGDPAAASGLLAALRL